MTRILRNAAIVCCVVPLLTAAASAQSFTGTQSCGGSECHTKSGEINWHSTMPGGKEHRASIGRLKQSTDKSEKYAKDVGLADFLDGKGMCVKCHGQPVGGVIEGVGCEGCHGPAGGYRTFHQQSPKDYRGAVGKGMRDLQGKPTAWAKVCVSCHVLDGQTEYDKLLESGHPDGKRWKPQNKYTGVQAHWKRVSYTVDVITAAAAGKPVSVAVAPAAAASAPAAPAATPAAPPTAPPATTTPTPPPATTPAAPTPGRAPTSRAPSRPPAVPAPIPVPPPPVAAAPAPTAPAATAVVAPVLSLTPPPPSTPSELLAALQTRIAGFFTRLLESGVTPESPLKPLPGPAKITGPDAELLQLQAEALALAIEALNLKAKTPPKPPDK